MENSPYPWGGCSTEKYITIKNKNLSSVKMKPPSMQLISADPCLLHVAPGEVRASVVFVAAFKVTISKMYKTHHHSLSY